MSAEEPILGDYRLIMALGSLATAVSCELSNPLAFMLSNLAYACEELDRLGQTLKGRPGDLSEGLTEVRDALFETSEGAHRLKHLLNDLRQLTSQTRRLYAGQQLPDIRRAPTPPVEPDPAREASEFSRARLPDSGGRSVWQGRGRRGVPGPRWAGAPTVNGEDVLPGNDRSTLEAFRRGDASVLTQVYCAYSPEVVRYLSRRFLVRTETSTRPVSLTPLDLESAHQETFVRAFRPSMRLAYDGVRPYLGFLLTIARSTAIDLMRASGRIARESISMDEVPGLQQLPGEAPDPEAQAMEAEVRGLVHRFLERLPEQERDLARLRFMEGLSQESAAERLQLTRGEVRVRERRLRVQFTEYLKASGWLESLPTQERRELAILLAFTALGAMGSMP